LNQGVVSVNALRTFEYHLKPIRMTNQDKTIVCKFTMFLHEKVNIFAAKLKSKKELQQAFVSQRMPQTTATTMSMCGEQLDDLTLGILPNSNGCRKDARLTDEGFNSRNPLGGLNHKTNHREKHTYLHRSIHRCCGSCMGLFMDS
jgi:hypothetical protein